MALRLLGPRSRNWPRSGAMLDREKIIAVLTRRFPTAGATQIAAAANAIVGLDDEWEEVTVSMIGSCSSRCYLKASTESGFRIRLFRSIAPD
jgi:hypothetical protein